MDSSDSRFCRCVKGNATLLNFGENIFRRRSARIVNDPGK
jgi:hypothetical protein